MKRIDEGESVMSEDFPEKLPCEKCNFVTSAKSKKDRVSGLKRHMKSQHPEALCKPSVTEEINCENIDQRNTAGNSQIADVENITMEVSADPKIEDEGMDLSIDEGSSNEQSSEENGNVSSMKTSTHKACAVCGWVSKSVSKTNQVKNRLSLKYFKFSSQVFALKRHLKTVHERSKEAGKEEIPVSPANPQSNLQEEVLV